MKDFNPVKYFLKTCIIILSICFFNIQIFANDNQDTLQQFADNLISIYGTKDHFTGTAVAVSCPQINSGDILQAFSGYKSTNKNSKIDFKSLWQIGSNTKSFASIVILQLEYEGKLGNAGIESTVGDIFKKYFPDGFQKSFYKNWYQITLKQLMNMTSGIPGYFDTDTNFNAYLSKNLNKNFSLEDILNFQKNKSLNFQPGSKWEYSDTNYILLGYLIKKITGNTPGEEIRKRIIYPLNLKNTFYIDNQPVQEIPDGVSNKRKLDLVHGYYWDDTFPPPITAYGSDVYDLSLSTAASAGSMISSPSDYEKYIRTLLETTVLLKPKQLKEFTSLVSITTGQPLTDSKSNDRGYGLGIFSNYDTEVDSQVYDYMGGTYGYMYLYKYYVKNKMFFSVPFNTSPFKNYSELRQYGNSLKNLFWQKCSLNKKGKL